MPEVNFEVEKLLVSFSISIREFILGRKKTWDDVSRADAQNVRGNKMPNLADLMKGRIEDLAKGPPTLPEGDYPGVIQKFELTEARNADKSPILRFTVRLLDWPDDDSIEDSQKERIEDISKRTVWCDYWFPLDHRYARLCQSCGIDGNITEQTNHELVGKHVTAQIKQTISKKSGEVFTNVGSLTGSDSA